VHVRLSVVVDAAMWLCLCVVWCGVCVCECVCVAVAVAVAVCVCARVRACVRVRIVAATERKAGCEQSLCEALDAQVTRQAM
jgi:hypothetical protein